MTLGTGKRCQVDGPNLAPGRPNFEIPTPVVGDVPAPAKASGRGPAVVNNRMLAVILFGKLVGLRFDLIVAENLEGRHRIGAAAADQTIVEREFKLHGAFLLEPQPAILIIAGPPAITKRGIVHQG